MVQLEQQLMQATKETALLKVQCFYMCNDYIQLYALHMCVCVNRRA